MTILLTAGPLFLLGLIATRMIRRRSVRAARVFFALGAALLAYMFWIEPRSLRVREHTIPIEGLAAPITALVIGDPQPIAPHWPPARLERAFRRVAADYHPDIIFWLGDYAYEPAFLTRRGIKDPAFVEPRATVAAMASISAPMGAYAVMGNHDWWWDGPGVIRLIRETDINLLVDRAVKAERADGAALWVVGFDDFYSRGRRVDMARALAPLDETAPVIALTHTPDLFRRLPGGVDLALAGRTHAGQINVLGLAERLAPIRDKRFVYGLNALGSMRTYVTSGIGTGGIPARLNAPPEVAILRLTPAP